MLPDMQNTNSRVTREKATVAIMIALYCHNRHKSNRLCPECRELLDYARTRLDECRFQESKPTCARCRVHCYQPVMRERIKEVMRYAGPRLIFRHPIRTIRHLLDGLRRLAFRGIKA
jgi:hypothetical protein